MVIFLYSSSLNEFAWRDISNLDYGNKYDYEKNVHDKRFYEIGKNKYYSHNLMMPIRQLKIEEVPKLRRNKISTGLFSIYPGGFFYY